jgi:hypothetical protein
VAISSLSATISLISATVIAANAACTAADRRNPGARNTCWICVALPSTSRRLASRSAAEIFDFDRRTARAGSGAAARIASGDLLPDWYAFDDLTAPDTLELLGRAPDPDRAAALSRVQIAAALRRANRRDVEAKAAHLRQLLRTAQLRQPPPVQAAYAAIVTDQVRLITTLNAEIAQLGEVVAEHFGRHWDAERYLS